MPNFRSSNPLGLHPPSNLSPVEGPRLTLRGQDNRPSLVKRTHHDSDIKFNGSIEALIDGEVREFDVSEYAMFFLTDHRARFVSRKHRTEKYEVLFVNGMQGSPTKFRAQACSVAALSGGPVWGVYNGSGDSALKKAIPLAGAAIGGTMSGAIGATAGAYIGQAVSKNSVLVDLIECVTDKLQSTDLDQFKAWVKQKVGVPQQKIENEMFENLSKYNRATGALYAKLLKPGFENARIVAHSQGNIITCNAVNAVAAVRGAKAIALMQIEAVASPVVFWSEAGMMGQDIVTIHALANDLVAWLGANVTDLPYLMLRKPVGRMGMEGTEVSEKYSWTGSPDQVLTHNFYAYLEKMWTNLMPRFP